MKSTPTRGVKQFLKPDAYKQSEPVHRNRQQMTDDGRQTEVARKRAPVGFCRLFSVVRRLVRRTGDGVPFVLWVSDLI